MLEVTDLQVRYQGIEALKGISLQVPQGRIVTLIGANGAGKSTLSGRWPVWSARREEGYPSRDRTLPVDRSTTSPGWASAWCLRVARVFANLSVMENLNLGAYTRPSDAAFKKDLEWVFSVFPRLEDRKRQRAGTLSGGEQQMLALGRALMAAPKLLMMDEPSLGLAPQLVAEVFGVIRKIHEAGTTILLIEQNAWGALEVADYAYVLETGRIALEGKGGDLLANDAVRRAYLGEG